MFSKVYHVKNNFSPNIKAIKEVMISWLGDDDFTCQYFLRGLQNKQAICTYEAYENEKLVGLITAWKSQFHRKCTYFAIVTKAHFGYDIESALFKKLLSLDNIKFPLQTSVWESTYRLKTFYEEREFIELRRTYMPLLRVSKIELEQVLPEFNHQDIQVKDIKSISNHKELKLQLINLVKENYEKIHVANPVASLSLEKWEELIFSDETIREGSFVALKDNEIYAYSLLHYSDSANKFEFGWRGTRENADIRYMLLLTAYQINFGYKNSIHYIEAEVDSTDYFSIEMLKFFPFSPTPSLLTFQKMAL